MPRLFPLLFLSLLFTSCPPDLDQEPAYVYLDNFNLQAEPGEGAPTTAFTEVWAFADGEFLGVFPLPARIPLFRSGEVTLRLEAGIHQDGRSVTPEIYPFYTAVERNLTVLPGEMVELGQLDIGYREESVFGFVEGFEAGTTRVFTEALTPGARIQPQSEVVRSGEHAGALTLSDTSRLAELATGITFSNLNVPPVNVWLEVDFRSDAPTLFGVVGSGAFSGAPVFNPGFVPRSEWTKIYFNLGPVIGTANENSVRIALSSLLPDGLGNGTVYLDNLKLLYFVP